ncbi:hypothetical protein BC938DRAFT_474735 [Jimgerdemannia flammicorona]|uniref:Uncharacterized protein n=1 Tax=Jimgerdemannia flammicorona TaxID=994334 RepID=A0A433Q1M1_9FUNG|nr:hypothetical protein BC938DRAFT_474735 [Jimgerdemannia flammicorona]
MLLKKSLFLLGALFATTVLAAPLQDISETSVELASTTDDHLTVTVTRVDDLLTDNGEWLAERVMAIVMKFDVEDDQHTLAVKPRPAAAQNAYCAQFISHSISFHHHHQILLNGVPFPLGVSSIQIQAAIVANTDLLDITTTDDAVALAASFDTGLVTVEVEATAEHLTTPEGASLRRIVVTERIVEVDGLTVVQTEAGQQIIDVYDDGTVQKYTGGCGSAPLGQVEEQYVKSEIIGVLPGGETEAETIEAEESKSCSGQKLRNAAHRFSNWYNSQPLIARASLAAFTGAVAAAFFAIIYRSLAARRSYAILPTADADAKIDAAFDEKYPVDAKMQSVYEDEEKAPLV